MSNNIIARARRVLVEHRSRQDGSDPHIVNLPSAALTELLRAVSVDIRASVRQVSTIQDESWDVNAFEHVVWRELARSGRSVSRIYIIPHKGFAAGRINAQLEADRSTGVDSRVIVVSKLRHDVDVASLHEMWLLDNDAVVLARGGITRAGASNTRTVSSRDADIHIARERWDKLWSLASEHSAEDSSRVDLEEPLVLTADLISGVAPILCTSDHIDLEGCSWYHGAWQYLRLLDMVSTPTWHDSFYKDELALAVSSTNAQRVLITGTADYSVFAYATATVRGASMSTELCVLDLCPTPLFACRWYAKRADVTARMFQEDFFEFKGLAPASVDVICTDAFLTRFPPLKTAQVAGKWAALLRAGGKLVTTVRIHARAKMLRDPEVAIEDFRERAIERARRWQTFLKRTPDEIGDMAEKYARKMRSQDLGQEQNVKDILEGAGFRIDHWELAEVAGELQPSVYLRLSCTREE